MIAICKKCGKMVEATMEEADCPTFICLECYDKEQCKKGNHRFVECDEWESTCIICGKFKS